MIYEDFESILVPEKNGKQNPDASYMNKYKKHVACSYWLRLVCIDDKFSKPFKSYLGEDAVYNFINSMVEESKYCSNVMKKHSNKELAMTKKMLLILRTTLNVRFVIMFMLMVMLK